MSPNHCSYWTNAQKEWITVDFFVTALLSQTKYVSIYVALHKESP